jgi:excinuclease ABC subunit C
MRPLFAPHPFDGFGPSRFWLPALPGEPGITGPPRPPLPPLNKGGSERGFQCFRGEGRAALRRGVRELCPSRPGVYGMLNSDGDLIYIGKAKKLRARLLSYFRRSSSERRKASRLLRRTSAIAWECVPHEFSALLRELELIRAHRPRFNVMGLPILRRRAYICLGRAPAPFAYLARHPASRSVWFGPVMARPELQCAVRYVNDVFKLRDCPRPVDMRFADQLGLLDEGPLAAACIRHELGTCLGPCAGHCTAAQYRRRLAAARRFLEGDDDSTLSSMREEMTRAAAALNFERAGVLRDTLQALEWLAGALKRLRQTRGELSFIYPVMEADVGRPIWYLIHGGQVCRTIHAPATPQDRAEIHQLLRQTYFDPPRVGATLEAIDHVWLVAAWFRKYPLERSRAIPIDQALRSLAA